MTDIDDTSTVASSPEQTAPRQRRDPAAKATEALRIAENRLERLTATRENLHDRIDAVSYQIDAARQHTNYLASHPLLQVEALQANLGTNSSEQG